MEQLPAEYRRNLFPNRRSKYVFLLRVSTLVLMLPALALYALWQSAPAQSRETTTRSTSPQAEARSFSLVTAPETSMPESSAPDPSASSSSPQDEGKKLAGVPTPTALPPGMLPADIQVISQDDMAVLKLPNGTMILDAQGRPPASLTVKSAELPLRTDVALVGFAYEFGPEGVTIKPPAEITINFNPFALYPFQYQNVDCDHMHMAYYNPNAPTIFNNSRGAPIAPWLEVKVSRDIPSVTAKVDHLGLFIIFCELFGPPIS